MPQARVDDLIEYTPAVESQRLAAFLNKLRDLGWIEGQTVAIEIAWGEGLSERFAEIARRFVRLKVDVIVTSGTATVVAAKQATTVIPIVFAVAGDPVANNLVESLARPAGNITGLSTVATDLASKRVELLREAVPGFDRWLSLATPVISSRTSPGTLTSANRSPTSRPVFRSSSRFDHCAPGSLRTQS